MALQFQLLSEFRGFLALSCTFTQSYECVRSWFQEVCLNLSKSLWILDCSDFLVSFLVNSLIPTVTAWGGLDVKNLPLIILKSYLKEKSYCPGQVWLRLYENSLARGSCSEWPDRSNSNNHLCLWRAPVPSAPLQGCRAAGCSLWLSAVCFQG